MTKIFIILTLLVNAKLSWYNPALCATQPINCFNPAHWWTMASGRDARKYYWRGLACPMEYEIGSRWTIEGSKWDVADGEWICLDRGGMIVTHSDGSVTLDLLTDRPIWADKLTVKVTTKKPDRRDVSLLIMN